MKIMSLKEIGERERQNNEALKSTSQFIFSVDLRLLVKNPALLKACGTSIQ